MVLIQAWSSMIHMIRMIRPIYGKNWVLAQGSPKAPKRPVLNGLHCRWFAPKARYSVPLYFIKDQRPHHLLSNLFSAVMQCCWTAALVSIPSDVTQQHIMRLLSRADLVALGMTCSAMQKIFSRWMLCLDEKERSKARFQSELLDELFRVGCFSQLVWFQKSLKYLCRDKLNEKKKILLASKGDELPRLVMQ